MNPNRPADKSPPGSVRIGPEQVRPGGQRETDTGNRRHSSTTPTLQLPIPAIPDHELPRRIGGGSYGEVWLARNVLGDYRAVKVIYRDKFEHDRPFEREFEGIQKFEPISRLHESQVDILHVGRNDQAGYFYYVMELADDAGASVRVAAEVTRLTLDSEVPNPKSKIGQSLLTSAATYVPHTLKLDLYRRGRLPMDECIQIGLALTIALQHLHVHGLVHRDIKPSNIIFVGGVPKLADIGLVASTDATMSFVGTPGFLPPEGPGTPQGDIYSLGKVLYELCTGRDRQEFPKLPADLAEFEDPQRLLELNAVILKACHRDPRQRYQTAKEIAADLALLQRGESVRRKRIIGRRLVLGAKVLSALAVVGLMVIGGYSFRGTRYSSANQHKRVENPEVASLCKLGRFHYYKLTDEGYLKAMECFNKALEIDPNSVEAYASIADLCVVSQPSHFLPPKAAEKKMRWVRDKLMAIDSRLAEGHAVQGFIHLVYDWKPDEAERGLKLALQLNPELLVGHIWHGRYLLFTRQFSEAEEEFKNAQRLDPTRYGLNVHTGLPSLFERDYDRAIELFSKAAELMPDSDWALLMIGRANEEKGDYQTAIESFQRAELAGGGKLELVKQKYDDLREAYKNTGPDGYWRKALDFVLRGYERWSAPFLAQEVAGVYARLADKEKAFEWLDKAFQEKSERLLWLNVDPCWDNIRSDPRFVALLNRMGFGGSTGKLQQLSPAELAGTRSQEAYMKYEQGRAAERQGNAEGDRDGMNFMREALELDPGFLRAWAELFVMFTNSDAPDAKNQQRAIAKKLGELNADSADAHSAEAWLAYEDFDFARADKEFRRAIHADSRRRWPHGYYACFLTQCGRLEEARKQLGEAEMIEPGRPGVQYLLGDCLFVERKYPQALAQYEKSLRLAQQEVGAYRRMGRLHEADHQMLKAIDAFQKARTLDAGEPERATHRYDALRQAFREAGEPGYWAKSLEQANAESSPEKQPYYFGVLHARLGHTDQALAMLKKAWEVRDIDLKFLILDQHWDDLRDHEQFKELLQKIGYRTDWPIK